MHPAVDVRLGQLRWAALHVHPAFDADHPNWDEANCSGLLLTHVAVPTAIQPIWHGSTTGSLRRLLQPCRRACSLGQVGCTTRQGSVIGRCNATHGVEYAHRLPRPGEPAVVSFNMPSPKHVEAVLAAIADARPRLYFEFEAAGHARVPRDTILKGVDGMMSFQRDALVPYPYLSASQLWETSLRRPERGFHERRPAVAAFVSNCGSRYRNEVVEFLRNASIEVHSYGACYRPRRAQQDGGANSSTFDAREFRKSQGFESGVKPECLHYRAILAVENSACTDYVTEKLIQVVGCGAVPIVRTVNGLPDYNGLYGRFPMLDGARLDAAFASSVRQVLTDQRTFESYMPWHTRTWVPSHEVIVQKDMRNPHCTLLDLITKSRETSGALSPSHLASDAPGVSSDDPLRPSSSPFVDPLFTLDDRNASRPFRQVAAEGVRRAPRCTRHGPSKGLHARLRVAPTRQRKRLRGMARSGEREKKGRGLINKINIRAVHKYL